MRGPMCSWTRTDLNRPTFSLQASRSTNWSYGPRVGMRSFELPTLEEGPGFEPGAFASYATRPPAVSRPMVKTRVAQAGFEPAHSRL